VTCVCQGPNRWHVCCEFCGECFLCAHRLVEGAVWKCHNGQVVATNGEGRQWMTK
jgi:hypothetical protein